MVAASLAACVLLVSAGSVAGAIKGTRDYVDICHATGDSATPYELMRVRRAFADGSGKKQTSKTEQERDHFLHSKLLGSSKGGLWHPGSKSWGDIIPTPKKLPKSNSYGTQNVVGWNYRAAGKAILAHGCVVDYSSGTTTTTAPSTTTTTSASTTTSSTTTSSTSTTLYGVLTTSSPSPTWNS